MVPMSDLFTLISFAVLGLYVSRKGTFRRSKAAPPPLPATSNNALLDVIAEGWEPMSSRALFAKLGMADGFAMTEFPLSSKELFLKLGMPEGFPVAPEPEPAKAQPAKEVFVDLPPDILREEVPLQAWEIAHADRASV